MGTETQGRRTCDDRDREWTKAATNQRTPRTAGGHQKPEEARKASPPEPPGGEGVATTSVSDFEPPEL